MKKKKKIVLLIIILIIVLPLIIIIYPISRNNRYLKNIEEKVAKNTDIKNIVYVNKDNNYYIVKNDKEIIVLDLNYEEVYKISLEDIKEDKKKLAYRRNNLYYEKKIKSKGKITYVFYNIKTLEEEYSIEVGG